MNTKKLTLLAIIILILFMVGCNRSVDTTETNEEGDENKNVLTLYTTIYPLEYFTARIGGDSIKVDNIVPSGSDAHSVEVTAKVMSLVAESDAFIHTGTGLEVFADTVADALENEDVIIVDATEGVNFIGSNEDSHDEHSEHGEENDAQSDHESDIDPHVWIDPARSIKIAENIKNALIELNPNNKSEFESNYSNLKHELEELNTEFQTMVSDTNTKAFVVSHSAYGYWEDAYGLEQIGISGFSPTDEPSQKKITELIELVKENSIQYIFFEQNLSNKVAEVVKSETGTEALILHNLESISEEDIKNNKDYFALMRENIKVLEKVLN